jgi:type II secretory ATPase GspE/PulE/Tfp pilus assembly ATPase PilB-like protein
MLKYSEINQEKTFQIIDTLIPLESCLYHQLIPISLEDKNFIVAMIKPNDELILDYLKSILPSSDHTLQVEQISPETHELIISSYQNYTRSYQESEQINYAIEQKLITSQPETETKKRSTPEANGKTLIIDSQELINLREKNSKKTKKKSKASKSLQINAKHETEPLETLTDLTPEELWQELLARLVKEGIGRLYFEINQDFGKIVLTKNGVITSTLEKIDPLLFQELFKATKNLANLPPNPLEKPRKIEVERIYQTKRLLLRFHLFPSQYGEQGTIQVLRDKALAFYQEQQMDSLGEQVLRLTKQLERKLQQIQDLKRINPTELEVLPQLRVTQASILEKLEFLD